MGNGNNAGEIKYIKDNLIEDIDNKSIVYTSQGQDRYLKVAFQLED